MNNKLGVELISVNRKPQAGRVVIWDSDNLVMNTNYDMSELTKNIVLKESLVTRLYSLLNEKATLLAIEIARNQSNSSAFNECELKLQHITKVFKNKELQFIEQVNGINAFDKDTLAPLEDYAQKMLKMLVDYSGDLEFLRLNSYILLTNLTDAVNTVDALEEATFSYRDKVNTLYNELLDLENRVNLVLYQLAVLKTRMDPAVRDMYKLRIYAYDLLSKYRAIYNRLIKLEIAIAANFARLCEAESRLSGVQVRLANLKAALAKLEARMAACIKRLYALDQTIGDVFNTLMIVTELASKIADTIFKMTNFINDGLVKPGDNIQIEYTESGHAIIHAMLPDYPERQPFVQQCFPQAPRNIEYAAPPCPPVVPPCPTTTTTTTTKKPDPPPACDVNENANGGSGTTVKTYTFAPWSGTVNINYDMLNVPDAMYVSIDGKQVATTGGPVSGSGTLSFNYPGSGTVEVKVVGSGSGTVWRYGIKCS